MKHAVTMPSRSILSLSLLLSLGCASKSSSTPPSQPPAETAPAETAQAVDPIPEGWFALTPQIVVTDVDAAMDYYVEAFGAEKLMTMPGPDGKTMHGEVKIGDSIVMIDAESPGMKAPPTLGGTPVTLMLYVPDVDETYQSAVDAGGTDQMPVEDMFWGDRMGEVADPFGHRWAIATHVEDLSPEQMQQRGELAMAEMPPPPKEGKGKAPKKKPKKNKAKKGQPKWKEVAGTPAKEAVPGAYHTVTMVLTVDDAARAIDTYKSVFGATETARMPGSEGKVMHAEVKIGDAVLMLSDEFPQMEGSKSAKTLGGSPVMIHHYTTDADATFAKATEAGAQALMPPENVFWGDRYAAVVDPVGMPWGIATHVEDVTPEQMAERAKAEMAAQGGQPPAESQPSADGQPPADAKAKPDAAGAAKPADAKAKPDAKAPAKAKAEPDAKAPAKKPAS
jgi:uncharacterized glyoxalase superfamily protein PhnB